MKKFISLSIVAINLIYAQTFNVSNTKEFREALQNASTDGENDTIILALGVYKTTDDGNGSTFIYNSDEDYNLTIQGSDANNTILSGDHKYQILNYKASKNTTLTLENLIFIDGNNTNTNGNGGAVYSSSNLIVKDCNFTKNSAVDGGGFYSEKNVIIKNSIFSNNISNIDYASGGGFFAYHNTNVMNSIFNNNQSANGGGFSSYGDTNVTNSTFIHNSARGGGGFEAYGNTTVINSIFINNSANDEEDSGGGGFLGGDNTTVINSIFINNSANSGDFSIGGGFEADYDYESKFITTVINSIFIDNKVNGIHNEGGSFFSDHNNTIVLNSLFISNKKGIFIDDGSKKMYIYNSIFKNNNGYDINESKYVYENNATVYLYNNYIDLARLNEENISYIPKDNIFNNINLGFKDPAHGNYELTASSGLIDKGTININGTELPSTDLAGNPRIVGKSIDIGPYEYQENSDTNQTPETKNTNVNETDIKVGAGWNMIDIPKNITDLSTIDSLIIWKWNSDYQSWEVYSKNSIFLNKLKDYNITTIDTLKLGDGVWVNEDSEKVLKFVNPVAKTIDWLTLNFGWNLKGTGEDINLTEIPSKVEMVWYWDNPNKKWMVYSNNETLKNTLQSYYSKGTFEKLNKLEANKAYWFFVK